MFRALIHCCTALTLGRQVAQWPLHAADSKRRSTWRPIPRFSYPSSSWNCLALESCAMLKGTAVFKLILQCVLCCVHTQEAPSLLAALASADVRLGDLRAAADSYHRATGDVTVLAMTVSSALSMFGTSSGSAHADCRCGAGWEPHAVARIRTARFCRQLSVARRWLDASARYRLPASTR
jgi:hypothetical protein